VDACHSDRSVEVGFTFLGKKLSEIAGDFLVPIEVSRMRRVQASDRQSKKFIAANSGCSI
jgi:hypothetical protein